MMIDFSGRGKRGLALAATASFLAVIPLTLSNDSARADGPVGSQGQNSYGPVRHHAPAARIGHRISNVQFSTSAPAGAILPGGTYSWPYSITNKGPVPAKSVTLSTALSPGLRLVSVAAGCHWHGSTGLSCAFGTLGNGQTRIGTFTATVAANATGGMSLASPAIVSWHNSPEQQARAGVFPGIVTAPASPSPCAMGSASPSQGQGQSQGQGPGSCAAGSASATPGGAGAQTSATPTPSPTATASTGGSTAQASPSATPSATPKPGQNGASTGKPPAKTRRSAGECVAESGRGSVCRLPAGPTGQPTRFGGQPVVPAADLALSKAAPALVRPGQSIGYRFTVTNVGSTAARNIVLNNVPTGRPLGRTRRASGECVTEAGRGFVCRLPYLPAGHRHTFTMTAWTRPSARSGAVRCVAAVTSPSVMGIRHVTCTTRVVAPFHGRAIVVAPELPGTGSASLVMAAVALNCLIAGAVFIFSSRPRRRES